MGNAIKTTLLMATMTALVVGVAGMIGGQQMMVGALAVAALMNFGVWFFSDQLVLRTSGAQPIDDPNLAWLLHDVDELADKAGMPTPRVYWVSHETSPNAFATGRSPSKGVVAVTRGLLETLDRRQIKGVLAHELGHIKHRDTLTSAVMATLAGAVTMLSRYGLFFGGRDRDTNPIVLIAMMILGPLLAGLLHMAVSRTREYAADRRAAELTGDPEGLAQALERIHGIGQRVPMHDGNQATHYIANNFGGSMGKLFSTHPPMEERVARLRAMR